MDIITPQCSVSIIHFKYPSGLKGGIFCFHLLTHYYIKQENGIQKSAPIILSHSPSVTLCCNKKNESQPDYMDRECIGSVLTDSH